MIIDIDRKHYNEVHKVLKKYPWFDDISDKFIYNKEIKSVLFEGYKDDVFFDMVEKQKK